MSGLRIARRRLRVVPRRQLKRVARRSGASAQLAETVSVWAVGPDSTGRNAVRGARMSHFLTES
jgi:hypothetical protein